MPYVASVGTYLPCWGTPLQRVAGDDEDAVTMAVEAGRAALTGGGAVERVVLVSRDLPLLESSNAAVLLAGLGLDPELEVDERLGGAPATLDALSSARPRTLIIGVDLEPAGAAAILTAEHGLQVRTAARVARSLPVRTRNATGGVHDYGDPRLLHERGLIASLAAAWLDTPAAVAGVDHERAAELCLGDPPPLPTTGASASLFALAGMAERGRDRPAGRGRAGDPVRHHRQRRQRESAAGNRRAADAGRQFIADADIPISLAAYERAFEAKVRWEAGRFADTDELDFPPRYRVGLGRRAEHRLRAGAAAAHRHGLHRDHRAHPGARPADAVLAGDRRTRRCRGARTGEGHRRRGRARSTSVTAAGWRCAGWRYAPECPDYGYAFEPEPERRAA